MHQQGGTIKDALENIASHEFDELGHGINSRMDKLIYITIATFMVMLCTLGAAIASIFLSN